MFNLIWVNMMVNKFQTKIYKKYNQKASELYAAKIFQFQWFMRKIGNLTHRRVV